MIRVIIERAITEGCLDGYLELIRQARKKANRLEGFIAGELLQERGNPHKAIIISSWDNHASWEAWSASEERAEVLKEMRSFLDCDEMVTVLENSNILS